MSESSIRKSAAASTVRGPSILLPTGVRRAAWFAVLMFVNIPALIFAQPPCLGNHVKILNIETALEP